MTEDIVKLTYLEQACKQAEDIKELANQLPLDNEGKALLVRLRLNHLVGFLNGGQSAGVTIKVIKAQQESSKESKEKE